MSRLRSVFIGKSGIRTGWRFIIFILILVALYALLLQGIAEHVPIVHNIVATTVKSGVITPAFSFVYEGTSVLIILLATWMMARIERKSIGSYGLQGRSAFGRWFWLGMLAGLVFESAEMILMWALGGYSFGALALESTAILGWALIWAVAFVLVGVAEEATFRGYPLYALAEGIGFWPAAIVLSAVFGAVHLGNQGEGWIGAFEVFAFAMFACLTLKLTGSLWFAIGFHASSDYAETFLFSVPDSGMKATHVLLNSSVHGPRWLTGGTVGPEGSVIDFILLAFTALIFAWWCRPARETIAQ